MGVGFIITAIGSDGKTRTYSGTTSTEINQALSHGGLVTLDPSTIYTIKDSLLLQRNTTLDGNGATIKLSKGLSTWGHRNAPISQEKALLMIKNNSASNVIIRNLTVDGSQADYYPHIRLGTSCFNMATLIGCTGLIIENCTFKNGCNDAIIINKCSNVKINKITVNKCGHDGVYCFNCKKVDVLNSKFINRTNSSCRFYNLQGGSFLNNDCTTSGGGYAGLELQGELRDITAFGNYFHNLAAPAIVHLKTKEFNVKIYGNKIVNCG